MSLDVTLEEENPLVEEDSEDEIFWGPMTKKEELKASKIKDRKTMLLVSGPLYRKHSSEGLESNAVEVDAMGITSPKKDAALDQEDLTQNDIDKIQKQEHQKLAAGKCETVTGEEFIDSKQLNKLKINDVDENRLDSREEYLGHGSVVEITEDTVDHSHIVENSRDSLKTVVCSGIHSNSPNIKRKLTKTDVTMESSDTCYSGIKSTQSCESPTLVETHGHEHEGNINSMEAGKELSQVEGSDTNVASQSRENFRKYLMAHNLMSLHNDTERHDSTLTVPVTNQEVQVVALEEDSVDRLEGCDTNITPQDLPSAGTGVEVIFDHLVLESSEGAGRLSNKEVDVLENSEADIRCSDVKVAGGAALNEGLKRQNSQHQSSIQVDDYKVVSGESTPTSIKDNCTVDRNGVDGSISTAYQNSFLINDADRISNNNLDQEESCHVENSFVSADILEENEISGENLTNSDMCSDNFLLTRSTIDSSTGAICSESLHSSDLQTSSSEVHVLSNGHSREMVESRDTSHSSVDAPDYSSYSAEKCNAVEEEICLDGSSKSDFADCRQVQENGTDRLSLLRMPVHSSTEASAGKSGRKTDSRDLGRVDHKDVSELSVIGTHHEEEGHAIPDNMHSKIVSSQSSTVPELGLPLVEQVDDIDVNGPSSLNASFPAPETFKSFKMRDALLKTRLGTRESYYSSLPLIDVEDDSVYGDFLTSEDDSGLCHSGPESQNESLEDEIGYVATHCHSIGQYANESRNDRSLASPVSTRKPDSKDEQYGDSRCRSAVVTSMSAGNSPVSERSLEGTPPLRHVVPITLQQGSKVMETAPNPLQTVSHTFNNLPSTIEHSVGSLENSQTNLVSYEQQSLESSWESYGSVNKGMVITHSFEEIYENNEHSLEKEENSSDSKLPNSSETAAYVTAVDQIFSPYSQTKSGLLSYHTAVETMNNTASSLGSQDSPKRCFNDTIEEMEMLLKYGIDYEEKMLGVDGQKSGSFDDTDDDPIVSPLRKTSVSSTVSNISFKPMMDSTRASSREEEFEKPSIYVQNDKEEPVKIYSPENGAMSVSETEKAHGTEAQLIKVETRKQDGEEKSSGERRMPPPKPPRLKGAECMTPIQMENDKDRVSSCNSAPSPKSPTQRPRSPTRKLNKVTAKDQSPHEQGSVYRNQTTPAVTPVRAKALASNLVHRKIPSSSNTVTPCRTKILGSNCLPEKSLTPQYKIPHPVHNTGSVGKLQYRKQLNLGKKQGIDIVSPVARYLKENPPPPLVRIVKPKHKISPLKMNSEIDKPSDGTDSVSPCIPFDVVSHQQSQSPSGGPESGTEVRKKTSMDARQAVLDKIGHSMAKLHDKMEEGQQPSKSRHGKGTASVLPVRSYSAATPVQYDDEKENRRIRRDILGEKPAKRVVRHKGRMKLPKVNFVEGLESASPNSSPAKIKSPEASAVRTSSERGSLVEVSLCEPHQVKHTNTLRGVLKPSFD